jgi:iron complex outermembrane receptor protein
MNQFQLKPIVTAVALTLVTGQAHFAYAADAEPVVQKVVVTGSNIKRIDSETSSPVTVMRREDIKATGANTVRQILDTLTSFESTTLRDDGSSSSFARGATGAAMRGLGKGATLVLVNGRRVSNYALADGGKDVFVNVDSIPADAIERVEVLRDGASAIYGSDAMAGVINIITRDTYQGVRVSGSAAIPESHGFGKQATLSILGGWGDLNRDNYNVFANLEAYKRTGYTQAEAMGSYPAWHKQYVNPAFGDPSLTSYPGNLNEAKVAGANGRPAVRQAVAGCPAGSINAGGLCGTDLTGLNQFSDGSDRLNLFSQGRLKINENLRGFAEVSYSKTRVDYRALPFGMAAGSPWNWFDGNTKTSQSVQKPKLAVGNPANPFNFPVGIDYRFMDDTEMWKSPIDSTQYRVMGGLDGSFSNGWEWQAAVGRIGGNATSRDRGAERTVMPQAIASGEYKIGGKNSAELLSRMFPVIGTDGKVSQDFIDGKVTGELFSLPAGPLSFALGGEIRREKMYVRSTDNVVNAQIISRGSLWIDGARDLAATFVELNAPVTKSLEMNGALRLDKASGFDAHVSPKLGARYTVTPELLVRGTLAGGFRSPNIPETLGKVGLTGFFNNTLDPKRCDTATKIRDILKTGDVNDKNDATTAYNSGCLTSIPAMISANPGLKPETSVSTTLGLVFQPTKQTSIAIDYYKIERRNEIASRDIDYVLAREDSPAYTKLMVRNPVSDTDRRLADRANTLRPGSNLAFNVGTMQSLLLNYENFGKTETSGVDFDFSTQFNAGGIGKFDLGLVSTYALSYRTWDIDANAYRPNTVGLRNTPRLTSVLSLGWKRQDWATTVRVTHVSSTALNNDETDEATWNVANCTARIKPGADLPCYRPASLRADLGLTYTGFKNTRLTLNIRNIFLNEAPISLRDGYAFNPRTIKLGAEYEF